MNFYIKKILFTIVLYCLSQVILADSPYIVNINKKQYKAENKNWCIAEDEQGIMYFGNDAGLLEFNGVKWVLNQMPNASVNRSLAVLSHNTIFTGGYEEFGRWDRDISGSLNYTSLSQNFPKGFIHNEDFWKIQLTNDGVYFQSFRSIYFYDYKTLQRIDFSGGFLFLNKVRDELIVQQMRGSLYKLKGSNLTKIKESEIFKNSDVRVILPYGSNGYLIGTSLNGIYVYNGENFKEWNTTLSLQMKTHELNCGLVTTKGTFLFGTILDGIYEVDQNSNIVNHISTKNTLQNNTILSLFEDNLHNIWVGLDAGLAYIHYSPNISCFIDFVHPIGTVYDAAIWNNMLFVGTNQGLFYIPKNEIQKSKSLLSMKLIDGTKGQVWSLKVVDGRLYCSHNRNLKEILPDLHTSTVFSESGVYSISENIINNEEMYLLSTYRSLVLKNKKTNKTYSYYKQISEPIVQTEVDHLGNIWLKHANKGVYRCQLSDDMSSFRNYVYYGGDSGDNLPYNLDLFKVGGRIVLLGEGQFYTYDDVTDKVIPNTLMNEKLKRIKNIKRIITDKDNLFWALTTVGIYKFYYDGYDVRILDYYDLEQDNLSLVYLYENLAILNDSLNLVCLDNGFLLYDKKNKIQNSIYSTLETPYIESIGISNRYGEEQFCNLSDEASIAFNYNKVSIQFHAKNLYQKNLSVQYMLTSIDKKWSMPLKSDKVTYDRLPAGKYTFLLRTVDNNGNYSETKKYTFEILSPWYSTFWAYLLYVISIILVGYIIWKNINRYLRNKHLQKIRAREILHLHTLTGKLKNEIELKNGELLTQTTFIIQKNDLIMKIKDIIDHFYFNNKSKTIAPLYEKIHGVLNELNTENDWGLFLVKFEEKHTNFFKNLKAKHPLLTSNDLRLCACLKLNLDSKEIASLMNLSVRAVENSRYRLRKKVNLLSSDNLNEYFINFD